MGSKGHRTPTIDSEITETKATIRPAGQTSATLPAFQLLTHTPSYLPLMTIRIEDMSVY